MPPITSQCWPRSGTRPDSATAVRYLRVAAAQGIADGQCQLGEMLAAGRGAPQDQVAGYAWMLIAIKGGTPDCAELANPLAGKLTAAQRSDAERRAAEFQPEEHPNFHY